MDTYIGMWGWGLLAASILMFIGIGFAGMKKTKTDEDFAVARGAYGPVTLAFAFAGTIASGATFMSVPGMAYSKGFAAIWYPATYPIAIYLGMLLAIRLIKRAGDKFRSNSLPEFLGQRYNSDFLRIGFALVSILLVYYIAAQIVAAATIFEVLLNLNYKVGVIVSVGVIALYVAMGGSHADIMTDGIQGVVMVLVALFIAVIFFMGVGLEGTGPSVINDALVLQDPSLGWDNYFKEGDLYFGSFWLVTLLFVAHLPFAMNPHVGKLAFALKDPKQIRTFMLIAIPVGSILGFTVLGGLHARALFGADIKPDAAIPVLFTQLLHPFFAGLLGIGVLSAIMSTADGLFISIAVIFSNDLYKRTFAPVIHKHKSKEQIEQIALNISRVGVVLVGVVACWLAWEPPQFLVVLLWIGVGGILSGATGPLLIGALWRRATKAGAIASFLVGVFGFGASIIYCYVLKDEPYKNPFSIAGLCIIAAAVTMIVVSLLTKRLPQAHVDDMFGKSA
ncbi:MAG: sodium:solute symporter family protein [Proteobacteria bacterium]|nr:sodium:solute symporter family protein [Pseudomonadota bacterium]MDA1331187.1 sodium:solute symporter family protein [Pseudomonadota bacterium]